MRKLSRSISFVLALVMLFTSASPALARSDNEEIAEQMAKAAAEGAIKELGWDMAKFLIDAGLSPAAAAGAASQEAAKEGTDEAAKEGSEEAGSSVGSETVAWVKLGLSLKDFFEAENDEARAWAAADVTVSVLLIACPPAGAIAAVVVLALKIVNMGAEHAHAKKMIEIAKRTQEHYEAIYVIFRQRAKADAIRYFDWMQAMNGEMKKLKELQEAMKASCASLLEGKLVLDDIVACQKSSVQVFPHVLNFLSYADHILGYQSEFISLENYYREHGKNLEDTKQMIRAMKVELAQAQEQAKKIYQGTGRIMAEAAVRMAIAKGNPSVLKKMRDRCFDSSTKLARRLNVALLSGGRDLVAKRARVAEVYSDASASFDGTCTELVITESDPLFPQLVLYAQSMHAAETFLFKESMVK